MYELKKSNIKFDQGEMGSKLINYRDALEDLARQNYHNGPIDPNSLLDGSVFEK